MVGLAYRLALLSRAGGAAAGQRKVAAIEHETVVPFDATSKGGKERRRNLGGLAADLAHKVAHRGNAVGELVQRSPVGEVDVADVAEFFQHAERPIDGTGIHLGQQITHALGRDRAGLGRQDVDHLASRLADASIARTQHFHRLLLHLSHLPPGRHATEQTSTLGACPTGLRSQKRWGAIHYVQALIYQGFVKVSALPRFGTADTLPSADSVGAARRKGRCITNVERSH